MSSSGRGSQNRRNSRGWGTGGLQPDNMRSGNASRSVDGQERRIAQGKGFSPRASQLPPPSSGARTPLGHMPMGQTYVPPHARSAGISAPRGTTQSHVSGESASSNPHEVPPLILPLDGVPHDEKGDGSNVSVYAAPETEHVADDDAQAKDQGVPPSGDSPAPGSEAKSIKQQIDQAIARVMASNDERFAAAKVAQEKNMVSFQAELKAERSSNAADIFRLQVQLEESEAARTALPAKPVNSGYQLRAPSIPNAFIKWCKDNQFERHGDFPNQLEELVRTGLMGAAPIFEDLVQLSGWSQVLERAERHDREPPYSQSYADEVDSSMAKVLAEWPKDDDLKKTLRAAIREIQSRDGTFACHRVISLVRESCQSRNSNLVLMRRVAEFSALAFRGSLELAKESLVGHLEACRQYARSLSALAGYQLISESEADQKWLENIGLYPKPISGAEKSLFEDYDDAVLRAVKENMEAAFISSRASPGSGAGSEDSPFVLPFPEFADPLAVFAEIRKVDAERSAAKLEAERVSGKSVNSSGADKSGSGAGESYVEKAKKHPHFAARVGDRSKPGSLKKVYKALAAEMDAGKPSAEGPAKAGKGGSHSGEMSSKQIAALWAGGGSGNGSNGALEPMAFGLVSCPICGATDHGHANGKASSYGEVRKAGKCPCAAIGQSPHENLPLNEKGFAPCWWCGEYSHPGRLCCRPPGASWCGRQSPYASSPAGQKRIQDYKDKKKAEMAAGAHMAQVPPDSAFAGHVVQIAGASLQAPAMVAQSISTEKKVDASSCLDCEAQFGKGEPCFPCKKADGKFLGMLCLGCNLVVGEAFSMGESGSNALFGSACAIPVMLELEWAQLLLIFLMLAGLGCLFWMLRRCLCGGDRIVKVSHDGSDMPSRVVEEPSAPPLQGENPAQGSVADSDDVSDMSDAESVDSFLLLTEQQAAREKLAAARQQANLESAARVEASVSAKEVQAEKLKIKKNRAASAVALEANAEVRRKEKRAYQQRAMRGGQACFCAFCGDRAERSCGNCASFLERCAACNNGDRSAAECSSCQIACLKMVEEIRQEERALIAPIPSRHQGPELSPKAWLASPPDRPAGVPKVCPKEGKVQFGISQGKHPGCAYWRCCHGNGCYFKWQPAPA